MSIGVSSSGNPRSLCCLCRLGGRTDGVWDRIRVVDDRRWGGDRAERGGADVECGALGRHSAGLVAGAGLDGGDDFGGDTGLLIFPDFIGEAVDPMDLVGASLEFRGDALAEHC